MLKLTQSDVQANRKLEFVVAGRVQQRERRVYAQFLISLAEFVNLSHHGPIQGLGDSGTEPLDQFLRRYGELRDELAMRRLRGEALSPRESLTLQFINRQLSELFEKPEQESPRITAAVLEAEQLLRRLEDGDP